MGEPQRRCSSCGESYAEGVIFCPRDGSALSLRGADAGPDPYLGHTLLGAFRIDALIGTGAVGRVYRAHQLGVERSVALKIMHRDLAASEAQQSRFRREARLAGSLSHPNVVSVLSLGELESAGTRVPFLVLEYLDGLSLRSALLAQGALPPPRALHILLQIADAVGEAHQRGIVHRDLKPENVMLVQRGDDADFVKVLDFGVARADVPDPSLATHAGAIFGSARYVAPECAAGGSSSPSSDVYALATLAYECLAGRTPFDGENAIQILLKQQSAPAQSLETLGVQPIPGELSRFIAQNLAKAPTARAADARVFARELMFAAREAGLDPGLSSRTRRGHAVSPALRAATPAASPSPDNAAPLTAPLAQPSLAPPTPSSARRALVVLLCFALGAGAALGIAARLGAFADKSSSPANGGAR
ncbi:MAG TPA: serine/threonine-protein kinase [Polyangiaceae bacterium]